MSNSAAEVERYLRLCTRLKDEPSFAGIFSELLEHRVEFLDTWDFAIERSWLIRYPANDETRTPELVPVDQRPGVAEGDISARVTTLTTERETSIVHPRVIDELGGELASESTAWRQYIPVRLGGEELDGAPIVRTRSWQSAVARKPNLLARLRPSSSVGLPFDAQRSLVNPVKLTLPPDANAGYVMFHCVMRWDVAAARLREAADARVAQVLKGELKESEAATALEITTNERHRTCLGVVAMLKQVVEECARDTVCPRRPLLAALNPRLDRRVPPSWTAGLDAAKAALDAWELDAQSADPSTNSRRGTTIDQAREYAESLARVLDARADHLVIGVPLQQERALNHLMVQGKLRRFAADEFVVKYMQIPFTTERANQPSVRELPGQLLGLAALLAAAGVIGLDLGGATTWLRDSGTLAAPDNESLVALLVLFPAALFAQFFQARPRTPFSVDAGGGLYKALSVFYILPIAPALWLALGGDMGMFGWIATVSAAAIACAAFVVWGVHRERGLHWLRRRTVLNDKYWGKDFEKLHERSK